MERAPGPDADLLERLQSALADRYAIERELGRGGMATVYLARDLKHGRPVALKVMRPELSNALGPDRFLREIGIAGRLQHPHILSLHDSGEAGGILYYVMPLVEGESLRARLAREIQLDVTEAVGIASQVADALIYAHAAGVLHRDIKPENILLSAGHATVADFGIARALDTVGSERLTETGLALGTPSYMSPEQAAGSQALDARSDLYALGCVLFEMLAGEPPFTGPTAQAIRARHAMDPVPSLHTIRSTIPAALQQVLNKALAKVPADRFATVEQFQRALASALVAPPGLLGTFEKVEAGGGRAGRRSDRSRSRRGGPDRSACLRWPARGGGGFDPLPGRGVVRESHGRLRAGLPGPGNYRPGRDGAGPDRLAPGHRSRRCSGEPRPSRSRSGWAWMRCSPARCSEPGASFASPLDSSRPGPARRSGPGVLTETSAAFSSSRRMWPARSRSGSGCRSPGERSGAAGSRPQVTPAAYEAYVRGAYFLDKGTEASFRTAIGYFTKAIDADPTFAAAYAGMAECYSTLGYNGDLAPEIAFPKARAAATRALELDSTLADAHRALAYQLLFGEWDFVGADREYARAVALDPSDAYALWLRGMYLAAMNRTTEAITAVERAQQLDPLSLMVQAASARAYYSARQYPEAIDQAKAALELDSTYPRARFWVGMAQEQLGKPDEAIRELKATIAKAGPTSIYVGALGHAYATYGHRREALQILNDLQSRSKSQYVSPLDIATVQLGLGDKDAALALLERAVDTHAGGLVFLAVDPRYDPVRQDPRFQRVLRRIGFPDSLSSPRGVRPTPQAPAK